MPPAPPRDGHRFVVQRHRARRLHYDVRLEADGVLISWAVPKGPTLDPDVRRLAVHVEDHPLEYFDFEGVIPEGEYGGGDVIVWDWGTWKPAAGTEPLQAIDDGNLHFDLQGEKLRGRFVLVRGRAGRATAKNGSSGGKEQWLMLHKHDRAAVAGWDPEEYPRSVKSGRTNDEVKAAPAASWSSNQSWSAPSADELEALDALAKSGDWQLGEHTVHLTNLDKVLFPAHRPFPAITKRDLIRYYASVAPVMLPYLADRPVNLHRFPDGIAKKGFWHKAAPDHAPDWIERWRNDDADPGETEFYLVFDTPAALAWAANYGAIEIHPWTSTVRDSARPTWAMIDIDPGTEAGFDDVLTLARLHRVALDHLGVKPAPKVDREAGHPDLGARGRSVHLRRDPRLGRGAVADDRCRGTRARQLGVEDRRSARTDPARLHPERGQQDARRAVQRPAFPGCAGLGTDHVGRTRRPRSAPRSLDHRRRWRPDRRRRRSARSAPRAAAGVARDRLTAASAWPFRVSGMTERAADPDLLKLYSFGIYTQLSGAVTAGMIHLGDKLGLFAALAAAGEPLTRRRTRGGDGARRAVGP